jgi:hypothetical protein
MSSPFNEMTTFLLSPVMVKEQCIFLYRAGMGDQDFIATDDSYGVVAYLTQGTIGIHTATTKAYDEIVAYLTELYGPFHDGDEECLIWEYPKPKSRQLLEEVHAVE